MNIHSTKRLAWQPRLDRWAAGAAFFLVCLLLLGAMGAYGESHAGYTVGGKPISLTFQEEWVLEQIAADQVADLKAKFGGAEEDRILGALFLKNLVTGGFDKLKIQHRGVAIANAVIQEPFNLDNEEIPYKCSLVGCTFKGPVNFQDCTFRKILELNDSQFLNDVVFRRMKEEISLHCIRTSFKGLVDSHRLKIEDQLNAYQAKFLNKELKADFSGMIVREAFIEEAEFQGPVDFRNATIGNLFIAFKAKFLNKGQAVCFSGMFVGDIAAMGQAEFHGPVDFHGMNIGGQFFADETQFLNKEAKADFTYIKVGKTAFFDKAVFHGAVDFRSASIGAEFRIVGTDFHNSVDFRDSSFQTLSLAGVRWPPKKDSLRLEGMNYKYINPGENKQDWEKLPEMIELAPFHVQPYNQLENFFRQTGYKDLADTVYIEGKRREVMQKWWHPYNLATIVFWDFLAGYGKKPARTLWASLIIIFIGAFVFDPCNFEPSFLGGWKWLLDGRGYKVGVLRFFLSLDEFLPGVDLGLAKLWQISRLSFPALVYYHFHKISGWILIPIGLAAVYTQFK